MKRLLKYLYLQSKELRETLSCEASAFDSTRFHALRVSIKKLKAIKKLEAQGGRINKNQLSFKPLQKLFKKAGKVRDVQLTLACLQGHPLTASLPAAIAFMELKSGRQKTIFFKSMRRQRKAIGRTIRGLQKKAERIKRKQISRRIHQQTNAAIAILAEANKNPAQWHKLRKIVKSLGYLQQASHLPLQKTALTTQRDSITQILGEWHDGIVVTKQINALISRLVLPDSENQALAVIQRELTEIGNQLLENLKAGLK